MNLDGMPDWVLDATNRAEWGCESIGIEMHHEPIEIPSKDGVWRYFAPGEKKLVIVIDPNGSK